MPIRNDGIDSAREDKFNQALPDKIYGYQIEREFGTKDIDDCIREIIYIHIAEKIREL